MDNSIAAVALLVAAIANFSEPNVKEAYENLKLILKQKFKDNDLIEKALVGMEVDTKIWSKPLEQGLQKARFSWDNDNIHAAIKLQRALQVVGVYVELQEQQQQQQQQQPPGREYLPGDTTTPAPPPLDTVDGE